MRVGIEVEACFNLGTLTLTQSPEYGDLTYLLLNDRRAKYWMLKTDSSLGNRQMDTYYQTAGKVTEVVQNFINKPSSIVHGLLKSKRELTDTFLDKLEKDVLAQIREETGCRSILEYMKDFYQREDFALVDGSNGNYYEVITGQAYKAEKFSEKPSNHNLEPLYYSELLPALQELYELIGTKEDLKFRSDMYMNNSCGMHLRVGEPYLWEDESVKSFNPRPLYRLKYRMLKWIAKNESPLDAWLFLTYYRRSNYSNKMSYANSIFKPFSERTEFSFRKGLEWRAFHCIGVKSYSQMVKRIEKGIDLLSDCYRQTLINNVYYHLGDMKPLKHKLQLELKDVPLLEEEELYV